MQVINPILSKFPKFKMESFRESGTWTVPEKIYHVWVMAFGAGGNPHGTYTSGAGGGHLRCMEYDTVPGNVATITVGQQTETLGANGQATSFSLNGKIITAAGGSPPTQSSGGYGGTGGGGGYEEGRAAPKGGDASYGGGGGGGRGNVTGSSAGKGGNGGILGGGGGACGRSSNLSNELVGNIATGGTGGNMKSDSTVFDFLVPGYSLGTGGASGEASSGGKQGVYFSDDLFAQLFFNRKSRSTSLQSYNNGIARGGVAAGNGGAGTYSPGRKASPSASDLISGSLKLGIGGCQGGGYASYYSESRSSGCGGGGEGFFSASNTQSQLCGGGGEGIIITGVTQSWGNAKGGYRSMGSSEYTVFGTSGIVLIFYMVP